MWSKQALGKWLVALVLVLPVASFAEDSPDQVLDYLALYDNLFFANGEVRLETVFPTAPMIPGAGDSTCSLELTFDGNSRFLSLTNLSVPTPKYTNASSRQFYDEGSNLELTHNKNTFIALSADGWKIRNDYQIQTISPDNQTEQVRSTAPTIGVYPVGDRDAANLFYRYVLPLGRGFSQLIQRIESVTARADGNLEVVARGKLFCKGEARWDLVVDPANDYLVREAHFARDQARGAGSSIFSDSTAGILEGPLPVNAAGSFQLAEFYSIRVSVKEYRGERDKVHRDRVSKAVNAVLEDTTILDYSHVDAVGRPMVLEVGSLQ